MDEMIADVGRDVPKSRCNRCSNRCSIWWWHR